ncbi:MAG: peptidylprolyl isomerase [Desulfurivibrionaceae bacterium]|jgi:cyclophilin family peptidyl-prolyl cis-trans isomerase
MNTLIKRCFLKLVTTGALICLAVFALLALPVDSQATMVRLQTSQGVVDIRLFDTEAPLAVANFLSYVRGGAYNNSFFHRSVPGFIIQGGGYTWNNTTNDIHVVQAGPAVANEFSASRSNVRGTIAMAKRAGDPNSATNEWFVNLADNAANLDTQNGGFTVFGQVTGAGMSVVDAIAALPVANAGSVFTTLPLTNIPTSGVIRQENLVMVNSITVLPSASQASDSDRLFNYLEAAYPQILAPASPVSATVSGFYYRYYTGTNAYIVTANGTVYYLGPLTGNAVVVLGTLTEWLGVASAAGY